MNSVAVQEIPDRMPQVVQVSEEVDRITISDNRTLQYAGEFLTTVIIPLEKQVHLDNDSEIEMADDLHKALLARRKRHLDPVLAAKVKLKSMIGSYQLEQQRLADLEAARVRAEEERIAREQREAEIRQAEELAQRQREAEATAQREAEEAREREIEAAEAAGVSEETISELVAAPLNVPVVQVGPTVEEVAAIALAPVLRTAGPFLVSQPAKVAGVSVSVDYVAEVTSLPKLIAAIARDMKRNPALVNLLLPNMPQLNAKARMEKELMKLDGVSVVKRPRVAGRGR